jgi:hypothetical protein
MHTRGKITGLMVVAALLLLLPALGQARTSFLAKGRTIAIRKQIAGKLNKLNLMHVGNRIRSQDIRIRTKIVKEQRIGAQQRTVKWRHKTGIVAGNTRSFTPIVPNGGRYTTVKDLNLTLVPRGGLRPPPALR